MVKTSLSVLQACPNSWDVKGDDIVKGECKGESMTSIDFLFHINNFFLHVKQYQK